MNKMGVREQDCLHACRRKLGGTGTVDGEAPAPCFLSVMDQLQISRSYEQELLSFMIGLTLSW